MNGVNIKPKHIKCPVCTKVMSRTEHGDNWVCNICDVVWFIIIVGKPNRSNEVNRIGG